MAELESLGTEQNRKVYPRHGIPLPMFGVSFAHIKKLAKRLRPNNALAAELWKTGNLDARILATFVANPLTLSARVLDSWARGCDNYVAADLLSRVVADAPTLRVRAEAWIESDQEFIGQIGWNAISALAMTANGTPDEYFLKTLRRIEGNIHSAKNRVRHAMNTCVIAVGLRNPVLRKAALETAKRIGKVEVDHGETGCKTPDAVQYIQRALAAKAKLKDRSKGKTDSKKKAGAKRVTKKRTKKAIGKSPKSEAKKRTSRQ